MKELKLTKYVQTNATVLDNEFIDHYMVRANGEYVKVYLLLLRHMNQSSGYLSVSELADLLECTEKDILRALRYWKSEGLLDYLDDTPDDPSPKSTAPSPAASSGLHDVQSGYMTSSIPADSVSDSAALASTTNIQQYRSRKDRAEFKELLFVAEQYLGKTLSAPSWFATSARFRRFVLPVCPGRRRRRCRCGTPRLSAPWSASVRVASGSPRNSQWRTSRRLGLRWRTPHRGTLRRETPCRRTSRRFGCIVPRCRVPHLRSLRRAVTLPSIIRATSSTSRRTARRPS